MLSDYVLSLPTHWTGLNKFVSVAHETVAARWPGTVPYGTYYRYRTYSIVPILLKLCRVGTGTVQYRYYSFDVSSTRYYRYSTALVRYSTVPSNVPILVPVRYVL